MHLFTRHACTDVEIAGHTFRRGDDGGCLLAAANRAPCLRGVPGRFDTFRPAQSNLAFGAGIHVCVGAPLARPELQTALPIFFARLPGLPPAEAPHHANLHHFHGLERLLVSR